METEPFKAKTTINKFQKPAFERAWKLRFLAVKGYGARASALAANRLDFRILMRGSKG